MYIIIFEDGTRFIGGSLENSLWNNIPDKRIKRIQYKYKGHIFILEGYENYNHIIEKSFVNNKDIILKIILMGKISLQVESIVIDVKSNQAFRVLCDWGKEYRNFPTTGWKLGQEVSLNPTIKII